jgi:hypothetical protein
MSDQGQLLPSSVIADLRLRWPSDLGHYAFLSAIAVTKGLVTILISVTTTENNSGNNAVLLAGLTLPKSSLTQGRTYALQSFQTGAGGFVSLGDTDIPDYSGSFSSPLQSLLTPRAARPARRPPVRSIGVENLASPLSGLVNLTAAPPLQIRKVTRLINGVEYDNVIAIGLTQSTFELAGAAAVQDSVFSRFTGPCGKRVGAKSCEDPQPVEFINGVPPDCYGTIVLEFQGCAVLGRNVEDCGVVIDCELGLSASCQPPYLPNLQTGELPNEPASVLIKPDLPPQPPVTPDFSISESVETVLSLPYCDTFDDEVAHGFFPLGDSVWEFVADDSPGEYFCCEGPPLAADDYGCSASSISSNGDLIQKPTPLASYGVLTEKALTQTNISLWTSDIQTLYRTYTTDFILINNEPGDQQIAGLVLNYRLLPNLLPNYVVAILDLRNSRFGIYFFNGAALAPLATAVVMASSLEDWYRMQVTVIPTPGNPYAVLLTAKLLGISDPTIDVTISTTLSTGLWGEDAANSGFYTARSKAYFSFWRVDEAT